MHGGWSINTTMEHRSGQGEGLPDGTKGVDVGTKVGIVWCLGEIQDRYEKGVYPGV